MYRVVDSEEDAAILQQDLDQLSRWARDWCMVFNPEKCYMLTITNKPNPRRSYYTMLGHTLQQVDHHPYLGVELSKTLDWGPHITNVIPKAQRSLNFLRRNLSGCSKDTKEKAYKSLVRPLLEYGSAAWDPYHASHIKKLESVQRRAARFATSQHHPLASVTNMMDELNWRTLQERRLVARLAMMYKAVHHQAACYIPPYLRQTATRARTSHQHQFNLPQTRVDTYRFSFFPRTIKTWNILPYAIVSAPDVDVFKLSLHQQFASGLMYVIPPKGTQERPRYGSTSAVQGVGPVY